MGDFLSREAEKESLVSKTLTVIDDLVNFRKNGEEVNKAKLVQYKVPFLMQEILDLKSINSRNDRTIRTLEKDNDIMKAGLEQLAERMNMSPEELLATIKQLGTEVVKKREEEKKVNRG